MRCMMIVKASEKTEAGVLPTEAQLAAMGKYNEELQKAGVLLDLSGLKPTAAGARVRFGGGKRTVIDGPFAETKELIAGYWVIQVKSRDEAIDGQANPGRRLRDRRGRAAPLLRAGGLRPRRRRRRRQGAGQEAARQFQPQALRGGVTGSAARGGRSRRLKSTRRRR